MRSSTSALALIFNLLALQQVSAQTSASLPACGQTCISNAMNDLGDECSSSDASCFCSSPDFGSEVDSCISQQCTSSSDQDATISYLQSYCGAASASDSTAPTTASSRPSVVTITAGGSTFTGVTQAPPFTNGTMTTTRSASNMTAGISASPSASATGDITSSGNRTLSSTRTPTPASTSAPNSGVATSAHTGMLLSTIIFAGLLSLGLN